ncbi:hypothetical protein ILUMI_21280 [Ignelater luminosus]|uniref:Uncharacterized protein n=1 Tax=Ignelater luminosus TaxID=2038154 RepID=A0A8K0G3V3_IGNLU|nr:hypothetical protein ILUMI_21280 [Ignelater luminosus]
MKDGKISVDAVRAQMAKLPPSISESAQAAFEQCKDIMKSTDKCEAAYEFYKCTYDFDPSVKLLLTLKMRSLLWLTGYQAIYHLLCHDLPLF